jgi:hypothetical protein
MKQDRMLMSSFTQDSICVRFLKFCKLLSLLFALCNSDTHTQKSSEEQRKELKIMSS